jgi:hypothetical protein
MYESSVLEHLDVVAVAGIEHCAAVRRHGPRVVQPVSERLFIKLDGLVEVERFQRNVMEPRALFGSVHENLLASRSRSGLSMQFRHASDKSL